MRLDHYGTMVMEQCDFPGSIGDSMAETSRYKHLKVLLGRPSNEVDLDSFVTDKGFIRHPDSPWREDDTSGDQCLPFYLAGDSRQKRLMKDAIKENKGRTGNGNLIHPIFFVMLLNSRLLISICLLIQWLVFKLPFRWSDSENKFEPMSDSSADYLNFIHCLPYSYKIVRKIVNKDILKQKVADYYKPEPNVDFLIELYDGVINENI